MRSVYVASSWRNEIQPEVVAAIREAGHIVYDFKQPAPDTEGPNWAEVMPSRHKNGKAYRGGIAPKRFLKALESDKAKAGFKTDYGAMEACDTCVLVLPCGASAHLELGWFAGQGKRTAILLDVKVIPELTYRLVDFIAPNIDELLNWLDGKIPAQIGYQADQSYIACPDCNWRPVKHVGPGRIPLQPVGSVTHNGDCPQVPQFNRHDRELQAELAELELSRKRALNVY